MHGDRDAYPPWHFPPMVQLINLKSLNLLGVDGLLKDPFLGKMLAEAGCAAD